MKLKEYITQNKLSLKKFHQSLCDHTKKEIPISSVHRWINGNRKPADSVISDAIVLLTDGQVTYRDIYGD